MDGIVTTFVSSPLLFLIFVFDGSAANGGLNLAPDLKQFQSLSAPQALLVRRHTSEWLRRYLAGIQTMRCSSKIERIRNSKSVMVVNSEVAGDEVYFNFIVQGRKINDKKGENKINSWLGSGNFYLWPKTLLSAIDGNTKEVSMTTDPAHHLIFIQYDVDETNSDWSLTFGPKSIRPAYRVVATLDETSGRVIRLQISSTKSPALMKMASADQIIEFAEFGHIGRTRDVPLTSAYRSCDTNNRCLGTRETFSDHRFSDAQLQFPLVDSRIYFDQE